MSVGLSAVIAISATVTATSIFATTPDTEGPQSPSGGITFAEYREFLTEAADLLKNFDDTRPNTYITAEGGQQPLPAASAGNGDAPASNNESRAVAAPTDSFDYSMLVPRASQTVSWDTGAFPETATGFAIWRKVAFKKYGTDGSINNLFTTEYHLIVDDDNDIPDEQLGTELSDTGSITIHYTDNDVLPFVEYNYAITPLLDGIPMLDSEGELLVEELEVPKVPKWHGSMYMYSSGYEHQVMLYDYEPEEQMPSRRAELEIHRKVLGGQDFTRILSIPVHQSGGHYRMGIIFVRPQPHGIVAYKAILRNKENGETINESEAFYIQQGPSIKSSYS